MDGGSFYFEQDIDTVEHWSVVGLGESVVDGVYLPHITEQAVFGEVTYALSDQLSITAGGRWFDNTFEFEIPVFEGLLIGDPAPTPLLEESSSSFTPKYRCLILPVTMFTYT